MKRTAPWLLLLSALPLLAGEPDHANCPMHAKHRAAEVDRRGDEAMGFSHEKTRHTFVLLEDGGAIEVRANDAADAESVKAIRSHLVEIAKLFTAGDFATPLFIHGQLPDGTAEMKALGAKITYRYEEIERGGRVRIVAKEGKDAVHRFLRFQIQDHRTGDHEHVTNR